MRQEHSTPIAMCRRGLLSARCGRESPKITADEYFEALLSAIRLNPGLYNLKRVINILGIARTMKAVTSMGA